jgi:hypothetical protein
MKNCVAFVRDGSEDEDGKVGVRKCRDDGGSKSLEITV